MLELLIGWVLVPVLLNFLCCGVTIPSVGRHVGSFVAALCLQAAAWSLLKNVDDKKWSEADPRTAVRAAEMGLSVLTVLTYFIRLSLWSRSRKWGAGPWLFALIPSNICLPSSLHSHSLLLFFSRIRPFCFSFCILSFTLNLFANTSRDVNEESCCWLLGRWPDKQSDLWSLDMRQFDSGKLNFIYLFSLYRSIWNSFLLLPSFLPQLCLRSHAAALWGKDKAAHVDPEIF